MLSKSWLYGSRGWRATGRQGQQQRSQAGQVCDDHLGMSPRRSRGGLPFRGSLPPERACLDRPCHHTLCSESEQRIFCRLRPDERRRPSSRGPPGVGTRDPPQFPDGFLWGVATSAQQIEGARRRAAAASRSGTGSPRRRQRSRTARPRRRLRPLPSLARGRRADDAGWASAPTASPSPGRGSCPRAAGRSTAPASISTTPGGRPAGRRHRALPDPLPLGSAPGPAGSRRLGIARHGDAFADYAAVV